MYVFVYYNLYTIVTVFIICVTIYLYTRDGYTHTHTHKHTYKYTCVTLAIGKMCAVKWIQWLQKVAFDQEIWSIKG